MRRLHFMPLSPPCRTARVALTEKRLEFTLVPERGWDLPDAFFDLNPAGTLPVLVEETGVAVAGALVIGEYLDDAYPEGREGESGWPPILPAAPPSASRSAASRTGSRSSSRARFRTSSSTRRSTSASWAPARRTWTSCARRCRR